MSIKNIIQIINRSESLYPIKIFGQTNKIITCMNSIGYLYARKHSDLYSMFDGIYIDGILMCKALKYIWGINITRRSFDMTSIAKDLFVRLNDKNCYESIYFIGSKQNQVEASVHIFKTHYPHMKVSGYRNGYFSSQKERFDTIKEIIETNPTYVIVGLGKPTQDYFAIDLQKAGFKGIVFTCGGFLHQSCNKLNYYPKWIDKYNLRWLYRYVKEGTWSRMIEDLFYFPTAFIFDRLKSLKLSNK